MHTNACCMRIRKGLSMTEPLDPPKIEFPCPEYPISVVCDTAEGFVARVCEIVIRHDPDFDHGTLVVQASRQGTYQSIRFKVLATSEQQLKDLHAALKDTGLVRMVL